MTGNFSRMRRILALHIAYLKSERILRQCAAAPDGGISAPFALVEKVNGAMMVMAVDRQAASLGLSPGMKLADARAIFPDLAVFGHDLLADTVWLDRLALACRYYTPMVSVVPPDIILLDITGCTHFYGSEQALADDVGDRMDNAGHGISWAIATTPDAAMALARYGLKEGAQAQLPVSALSTGDNITDQERVRALERAGLYHLGDLASRPRTALAARFGTELVTRLDRIMGHEGRPVDPARMVENIMAERRFAEPVTRTEFVTDVIVTLFSDAARQLEHRGQGARMVRVELFRSDGEWAQLRVESGLPTRDPQLFSRLLAEKIAGLDDPLNPGFGYDMIRLTVIVADILLQEQYRLDRTQDMAADRTALISRLAARLGRQKVRQFIPADSHIPEQCMLALPALDARPPQRLPDAWDVPVPGEPPLRPLFLFDPPEAISVLAEVPDGPPHRFGWRRKTYHVSRYEGPERIAAPWWQDAAGHRAENAAPTRDYYRVEDVRGRRYWLFRHGLYGREKDNPRWYIHGLFA